MEIKMRKKCKILIITKRKNTKTLATYMCIYFASKNCNFFRNIICRLKVLVKKDDNMYVQMSKLYV